MYCVLPGTWLYAYGGTAHMHMITPHPTCTKQPSLQKLSSLLPLSANAQKASLIHIRTFNLIVTTATMASTTITHSGRLNGKVAIVTGAGSGFGYGIAKKFVEEGAKVIVADISEKNGQAVAAELGSKFIYTDVTRREDWQALLQATLDEYKALDIVVNNAGATYSNKPTTEVTDADFDLCVNVNVRSIYLSTSVIVPYFLEHNRPGCFIQVSSTAALRPRPGLTWYNASKAAVSNATKTMAVEYGPKKIRFNCVCPVVGSTGM